MYSVLDRNSRITYHECLFLRRTVPENNVPINYTFDCLWMHKVDTEGHNVELPLEMRRHTAWCNEKPMRHVFLEALGIWVLERRFKLSKLVKQSV